MCNMSRVFKFNGSTIALVLLYVFAALPVVSSFNHIALYVTIPGAALLSLFSIRDRRQSKYMKVLCFLFLWIVFTSFFSYDVELSFVWLRRVLAVFLLCFAVHQLTKNNEFIPWVYLTWVIMYISCLFYAQSVLITDQIDYTTDRLNDSNLNANTLAYYTFFTTYIVYYLGDVSKKLKRLFRLSFLLTIPLSFYVALITASRQVLLIQVPLILFFLYIRYIKESRGIKGWVFVLAFFIVASLVASSIIQIYESSFLFQRSQIVIGEDIRAKLIRDGLKTGMDNLLTGVGIGCFGFYNYGHDTFAHNTYVELFATTGIVGFLLYAYLLLSFVYTQFKRYLVFKKTHYLVFMFVGLLYVVDNMFYVFHTDPWLMAFFILLTSHSEVIYKNERIRV